MTTACHAASNHPTAERRPAGWQRALRWAAWLTFRGLAIGKSQNVSFGGLEFLALAVAMCVSIFCVAKPLGGPKIELSEPAHMLGGFVSRTNWALVLIGALLSVGGIGATGAIVYDMATGRAGFGDVLRDIAIFVGGFYEAELEKTRAYALCILLLPGSLLLWYNLIPFFKRGTEFRVERDGVRLPAKTSAEFFRRRLRLRGFDVDDASSSDHFIAKRLP
jgi:hypothetical protein